MLKRIKVDHPRGNYRSPNFIHRDTQRNRFSLKSVLQCSDQSMMHWMGEKKTENKAESLDKARR
jgi:succinate dehydrogenase flavin-adding protein (antitoxin of CptAB toxin-antitoxin module)